MGLYFRSSLNLAYVSCVSYTRVLLKISRSELEYNWTLLDSKTIYIYFLSTLVLLDYYFVVSSYYNRYFLIIMIDIDNWIYFIRWKKVSTHCASSLYGGAYITLEGAPFRKVYSLTIDLRCHHIKKIDMALNISLSLPNI